MSKTNAQQQDHRQSPWNKGRPVGQKRPLKPKEVWNIRARLQIEAGKRDLAMFNLAIDSKLRGCDLVRLQIDDLCVGGRLRDRATIIQKKTGRPVHFERTEQTRASIDDWLAVLKIRDGRFLFPSRVHDQPHISTRQYARIVHDWVRSAGLDDSAYGTHSMRRTKAAQIYKKTGNLRAVQLLLGHTKLESTVRYLGIEVDDALSRAGRTVTDWLRRRRQATPQLDATINPVAFFRTAVVERIVRSGSFDPKPPSGVDRWRAKNGLKPPFARVADVVFVKGRLNRAELTP